MISPHMPFSSLHAPVQNLLIAKQAPIGVSAYHMLGEKYGIAVTFEPLTQVVSIASSLFKRHKLLISQYDAIIFNNTYVIDHFFELSREVKAKTVDRAAYYCTSWRVAAHLKKYVLNKRRKVYKSKNLIGFQALLQKHAHSKFLFLCSHTPHPALLHTLKSAKCTYHPLTICHVRACNFSRLSCLNYDMLALFSPIAVKVLDDHFQVTQLDPSPIRFATFGQTTTQLAEQKGWHVVVKAPMPPFPSMTTALSSYLCQTNR